MEIQLEIDYGSICLSVSVHRIVVPNDWLGYDVGGGSW